jgi:hypothetical protein
MKTRRGLYMVIHNSDFPMDDSLKWHPESLASEVVRPAPVRYDNCIIIGMQVMHVNAYMHFVVYCAIVHHNLFILLIIILF